MTLVLAIDPNSGAAVRVHTRAEAAAYLADGWRLVALRGA